MNYDNVVIHMETAVLARSIAMRMLVQSTDNLSFEVLAPVLALRNPAYTVQVTPASNALERYLRGGLPGLQGAALNFANALILSEAIYATTWDGGPAVPGHILNLVPDTLHAELRRLVLQVADSINLSPVWGRRRG